MIHADDSPPLHVIHEDTPCYHLDDFMKKTILSKAHRIGSRSPMIVQDNARINSITTQSMSGKKKKSHRQSEKKIISPKLTRDSRHNRLESSMQILTKNGPPINPADTDNPSPYERWSSGIVHGNKDAKLVDHRFSTSKSVAQSLTAALARDLKLSPNMSHAEISPFPRDARSGQRKSLSLNSIDPRHDLIRPERIPSIECLAGRQHSLRTTKNQQQAQNGERNFRWCHIDGRKIAPKRPSF